MTFLRSKLLYLVFAIFYHSSSKLLRIIPSHCHRTSWLLCQERSYTNYLLITSENKLKKGIRDLRIIHSHCHCTSWLLHQERSHTNYLLITSENKLKKGIRDLQIIPSHCHCTSWLLRQEPSHTNYLLIMSENKLKKELEILGSSPVTVIVSPGCFVKNTLTPIICS